MKKLLRFLIYLNLIVWTLLALLATLLYVVMEMDGAVAATIKQFVADNPAFGQFVTDHFTLRNFLFVLFSIGIAALTMLRMVGKVFASAFLAFKANRRGISIEALREERKAAKEAKAEAAAEAKAEAAAEAKAKAEAAAEAAAEAKAEAAAKAAAEQAEQDEYGTYTFPRGKIQYVGERKGGKPHGQGTSTHKDGTTYIGGWKDSKYHGEGTQTYSNGATYTGGWKDGKYHGEGTSTQKSGTTYTGGWKDSKHHGEGAVTYADGMKYVGGWRDGEQHGQGTCTWVNGDRYVGGWKDGNMYEGTLTRAHGRPITVRYGKPVV